MTGSIFDRGYIRELLITGTIVTVLRVMMLSLASEYYQGTVGPGSLRWHRKCHALRAQYQPGYIEIRETARLGCLCCYFWHRSWSIFPLPPSPLPRERHRCVSPPLNVFVVNAAWAA